MVEPLSTGKGEKRGVSSPQCPIVPSWEGPYGCACRLSRVRLFATLWTGARQAPLSVGFSRHEYWSRLPFPPPGDLPPPPDPGIETTSRVSSIWRVDFYHAPRPPPRKHARLGAATNGRGSERVSNLPEIMPLGVSGSKHRSPAQVQVKLWAGVLDSGVHGPQQAGRSQSARPVSPGGDKVSLGSGSQGQARRVVKGQGGHSAGSWWLSLTLVLAPLMESGVEAGDGNRGGVCRAQDPQVPLA